MAISRQKEARSRDYAPLLFWMTSRVLYSAKYHRQHCTHHSFGQFGALYTQPRMTNIHPDWYSNLVPPGYKPQSIRMSHRGWPPVVVPVVCHSWLCIYSAPNCSKASILGPLLFLIYINDLPFASKLFKFIIYADDTTLIANLSDFKTGSKVNNDGLNLEAMNITDWLSANKITLNIDKSEFKDA